VEVKSKKKGKLTIQCDEMWSFVGDKDNKQWIWLAIDVLTSGGDNEAKAVVL
jgi:hypothetical protein